MPNSTSSASGLPDLRACTECRRRKTKCSGRAPCRYCSRSRKPCIFGPAPTRTPLTRKNLEKAERRSTDLQILLRKLNPDIDIDEALNTPEKASHVELPLERPQSVDPDSESPDSAGRFEWNEAALDSPSRAQKEGPDGMALLPKTGGCGYLGSSSGTSLLKNISGLLPDTSASQLHPPQHQQEGISPETANPIDSPSLSSHLNNTALLDRLIDAYFLCYNSSYPILHETTFRQKYQSRQHIHPRSSWHLIFYLVLAVGDWILGGDATAESRFYASARSRMSMRLLESGTLLTVQAFLLMGNYLQKRDRPNTGYNFVGIAYRMALGLGLHREPPADATTDSLYNERRRVIWWIAYCFDSGLSLTTGRPLMVPDCFIETRLPRNIDDSTCTLDSLLPPPTQQPTTYSGIIAQAQLVSIGNSVYTDIINSKDPIDLRIARCIDHRFKAWSLSLPVYFTMHDVPDWFRGPRAVLRWREKNLRMMLWWGSQRHCGAVSDKDEAQSMCRYAAVESIIDIATFCLEFPGALHTGLGWYATYFLFQASIVLSIHLLGREKKNSTKQAGVDSNAAAAAARTNQEQEEARHPQEKNADQDLSSTSISRARDTLAFLSHAHDNKAAARCLAVLDRIRDQSLSTRMQDKEQHHTHNQSNSQIGLSHHQDLNTASTHAAPPAFTSADLSIATEQQQAVNFPDADVHTQMHDMPVQSTGPQAMDPSLQFLFEDVVWDSSDIFEGLQGFPSTGELGAFDYAPGNGIGSGFGDAGLGPS